MASHGSWRGAGIDPAAGCGLCRSLLCAGAECLTVWEVLGEDGRVAGTVRARHGWGASAAVARGELGYRLRLGERFAVRRAVEVSADA
jgi:hypothetical protein